MSFCTSPWRYTVKKFYNTYSQLPVWHVHWHCFSPRCGWGLVWLNLKLKINTYLQQVHQAWQHCSIHFWLSTLFLSSDEFIVCFAFLRVLFSKHLRVISTCTLGGDCDTFLTYICCHWGEGGTQFIQLEPALQKKTFSSQVDWSNSRALSLSLCCFLTFLFTRCHHCVVF